MMKMCFAMLFLMLGFVMLIKGADWFVDGASAIAKKLGIPQLVIGLTIVAMGTSAPEAAVSITAALKGSADITIGNIVGSNILNILVILGLSSVITLLSVSKSVVYIEIPFMIFITLLLLLLGMDRAVGRGDGILLTLVFFAYLTYLFVVAKKGEGVDTDMPDAKKIGIPKAIFRMVAGLILIIIGSNVAVESASTIARTFGMSERFIGLTIVALGTSLPELFTSVSAAKKGNEDIAIGNIVGSNIFNILFVVGISAIIINVPFSVGFYMDTIVAILAGILLWICSIPHKKLGRSSGIMMLMGYMLYFVLICV